LRGFFTIKRIFCPGWQIFEKSTKFLSQALLGEDGVERVFRLITFDFWNTLYKGPPDAVISEQRVWDVQRVLSDYGFEFATLEIQNAFWSAWQEAYVSQRVYGKDPGPRGQVDHVLRVLGLNGFPGYEAFYEAYTRALLKQPPEINDGVRETLASLQGRFKLAVICNTGATPGVHLRTIMQNHGLSDAFNLLVFSDEMGFSKPDPAIFNYVLDKLGCININAMHVGDDAITDVIGAKKAGMTAVWLAPRVFWPLPEADYCIESLPELIKLV